MTRLRPIIYTTGLTLATAVAIVLSAIPCSAKPVISNILAEDNPWKQTVALNAISPAGMPSGKLFYALRTNSPGEARKILAATPVSAKNRAEREMWEAACLTAERRYEEAAPLFDRVQNLMTAPVIVRANAAKSYAMVNNFDKAIAITNSILSQYQMAEAYKVRAGAYAAKNQRIEAALDFEKLADLETTESAATIYSRAASLFLKAGKVDKALSVLDKGDKRQPGKFDNALQMVRSDCYMAQGRWQDAANIYSKMIAQTLAMHDKRPELTGFVLGTCYKERAKCYRKLGKNSLAAADEQTLKDRSESVMDDFIGKHR